MKQVLAILFCLLILSCQISKLKSSHKASLQIDTTRNTRIENLISAYETQDYTKFFRLFPENYHELSNIYGFSDEVGKQPLYSSYEAHIVFLFNSSEVTGQEIFAKKIYQIAITASWEADAVNLFQIKLYEFIMKNLEIVCDLLSKDSKKNMKNFWRFVIDGSTKHDEQNRIKYTDLFNALKKIDPNQAQILKKVFESLY